MKNPLTVIAIFAVIVEVVAGILTATVNVGNKEWLVIFVVLFPTVLLILFFVTLNFNTKVLYAPSDYREDTTFLTTLFGPQSSFSKIEIDKNNVEKLIETVTKKDEGADSNLRENPFDIRTQVFMVFFIELYPYMDEEGLGASIAVESLSEDNGPDNGPVDHIKLSVGLRHPTEEGEFITVRSYSVRFEQMQNFGYCMKVDGTDQYTTTDPVQFAQAIVEDAIRQLHEKNERRLG